MKFRRQGRLAVKDAFYLDGEKLKLVRSFTHLISTGHSLTEDLGVRVWKAIVAANSIENSQKLYTAVRLFSLKIGPTASPGIANQRSLIGAGFAPIDT